MHIYLVRGFQAFRAMGLGSNKLGEWLASVAFIEFGTSSFLDVSSVVYYDIYCRVLFGNQFLVGPLSTMNACVSS